MNTNYLFHHMGVATKNIERCAATYANFGYSKSETIVEPSQNVKICFLTRPGSPSIELVEPLTPDAPVSRFVQSGTTPYHTCWEVDDIYQSIEELEDMNFRLMFEPLVSEAMDHGLFCYLFSMDIGLFELYQRKDA